MFSQRKKFCVSNLAPSYLLTLTLLSLALLVPAIPAMAQYSGFRDAVVAHFTPQDTALAQAALNEALNSPGSHTDQTPHIKQWQNPETSARGTVRAEPVFDRDGQKCRRARIDNFARGEHGVTRFTFCEVEPGRWKVLG